jgi:uncharacterized membrane protein YtjA (UPF0391 family)
MLRYSLLFLVVAILAAIFGFGITALAFAGVAKVIFFLFLVGFLVTMVMQMSRRV